MTARRGKEPGYHSVRDFEPITGLTKNPHVFVIRSVFMTGQIVSADALRGLVADHALCEGMTGVLR